MKILEPDSTDSVELRTFNKHLINTIWHTCAADRTALHAKGIFELSYVKINTRTHSWLNLTMSFGGSKALLMQYLQKINQNPEASVALDKVEKSVDYKPI